MTLLMRRRGLTILEVLIVVAIILGMAGLVLPVMTGGLAERSFAATAEEIRSHLLLARAEAMSRREAIEVLYDRERSVIRAAPFVPEKHSTHFVREAGGTLRSSAGGDARFTTLDRADSAEAPEETDSVLEVLDVPRTLRVLDRPPEQLLLASEEERLIGGEIRASTEISISRDGNGAEDPFIDSAESPTLRLAVFLLDGSALFSDAIWFADDGQRFIEMRLNPWTGVPQLKRIESLDQIATDEEKEEDETPPDETRDREGDRSERGNDDDVTTQSPDHQTRSAPSSRRSTTGDERRDRRELRERRRDGGDEYDEDDGDDGRDDAGDEEDEGT